MMFKTKTVIKECRQLTFENQDEIKQWCGGKTWSRAPMRMITGLTIPTLEGDHNAEFGDWIIKGLHGEFYPCKPDIFDKSYEPVTEQAITAVDDTEHK